MVDDALRRLASAGGPGLGSKEIGSSVPHAIAELLLIKNGFYAFNGALHVFPSKMPPYDLERWNSEASWRETYGSLCDGEYFFAEDLFGGQFSLRSDGVYSFDPETGDSKRMTESVAKWASMVLEDHEVLTGSRLAEEWANRQGRPLQQGQRLIPRQLFVLEGAYELDNLVSREAVWGMRARGPIALKLRDLPDGAQIMFEIE